MIGNRATGAKHAYLDMTTNDFSNLALGLLVRAAGHGLSIAYIDFQDKSQKLCQFLENLSLSSSFTKKFSRLHIETFVFKKNLKIQKAIIPQVEFYCINENIFQKDIEKFDLLILDNIDEEYINKMKLISILETPNPYQEIVCIFKNNDYFEEMQEYFDLISKYNLKESKQNLIEKHIFNITGNGKGKSTYSFGYILRNFIMKKDVKLIYFDKGGDFYGERIFFYALKEWLKSNYLYGSFDWVSTGKQRFDGKKFRFENIPEDLKEAKEGLMLLKTALKKQTPVLAEELNTTIKTGLLKIEDVLEIINNLNNELVITGRYSPKEILDLSDRILEVEEVKHYMNKGMGVRKGIDF